VIAGHRFFDIRRLAGGAHFQSHLQMYSRRSRDVNRIDIGVVNKRFGIVIPARHTVPAGVIGRQFTVAAHDGDQFAAGCLLKPRSAFYLGDITAADDPPAD